MFRLREKDPQDQTTTAKKLERPSHAPSLCSKVLLGNRDEVQITHEGSFYTLRRTRAGKLILTK